MDADDQQAAGDQGLPDRGEDLALQGLLEVGEGAVPAEDEIEGATWGAVPQVVPEELNRVAIWRLELIAVRRPHEGLGQQRRGQFLQAARLIDSLPGSVEDSLIGIGGKEVEAQSREPFLQTEPPEDGKAVWLLARGAARAPAGEGVLALAQGDACQIGEEALFEEAEHPLVSVEAGDRDPAGVVEDCPFAGIIFEVRLIGRHPRQAQGTDALGYPLADLAANLAEPGPPETETRQGPLEQLDALSIGHALVLPCRGGIFAPLRVGS